MIQRATKWGWREWLAPPWEEAKEEANAWAGPIRIVEESGIVSREYYPCEPRKTT